MNVGMQGETYEKVKNLKKRISFCFQEINNDYWIKQFFRFFEIFEMFADT